MEDALFKRIQTLLENGELSALLSAMTEYPAAEADAETEETPALFAMQQHAALLQALRPYLGAKRQERADRMLRILSLASVSESGRQ